MNEAFKLFTKQVLVADTTTPDWEPVVKSAAAVVTNRGGRTCHAAIVAREVHIMLMFVELPMDVQLMTNRKFACGL